MSKRTKPPKKTTPTKMADDAAKAKLKKAALKEIADRLEDKTPKPSSLPRDPKQMSAIEAAAKVLASSSKPMRPKELIAEMAATNLWKSPGGKTPQATLDAAIRREIATKGAAARFKKHPDGGFAFAGKAA